MHRTQFHQRVSDCSVALAASCNSEHTMILNDYGTYNSMSGDEMEALEHVAMNCQVNGDEDAQVFCDNDPRLALVVSKVLTLQQRQDEINDAISSIPKRASMDVP